MTLIDIRKRLPQQNLVTNRSGVVTNGNFVEQRHRAQFLIHNNTNPGDASTVASGLQFHRGLLNPEQVVDNGELAVSVLQKTVLEIQKIENCLQMMKKTISQKLWNEPNPLFPDEKLDAIVQIQLALIRSCVKDTTFRDRKLLNGDLGVHGAGKKSRVLATPVGFPGVEKVQVELQKMASHSILTGHQRLNKDQIQQETLITLSENGNIAKYRISPEETVSSLIEGLQQAVNENGLDLEITVNADGYLEVTHNQYGSSFVFSGRSQKTSILSKRPDTLQFCQLGENCTGQINGELVKSRGQLLLCEKGKLTGLVILWEGEKSGMEELVISSNSIPVSGGRFLPQSNLWISIPSMMPDDFARGVKNRSGFSSLADISVQSRQTAYDALNLIRVSMAELEECRGVLENKTFQFQEMAMSALMVTSFKEEMGQSSDTISENASLMAKMLEEVLAA